MRFLRRILVGIAVLLALLLGAAWVVPPRMDWGRQRDAMEALASAALGRKVRIEGAIGLTLLPVPMLNASGVRVLGGSVEKGPVLETARIAGIAAAKRTHELIPLCHPLPLSSVTVELDPEPETASVRVVATAKVTGRTGVEMEALTAVSVACLTVYDMVKAADKTMRIGDIRLIEKAGGRSGHYKARK